MNFFQICTFVAALATWAIPAMAQENENARRGIAFVEAPEMASGSCVGRDSRSAFACAKKQCIENGGTKEDCIELAYCFPAKIGIDISLQSTEGFSWHEFYCGIESRDLALAMAKTLCSKKLRSDMSQCSLVTIYDEDGNQEDVAN